MRKIAAPLQKDDYVEFVDGAGQRHRKGDRFTVKRVGAQVEGDGAIHWLYELEDGSKWWTGEWFKKVKL